MKKKTMDFAEKQVATYFATPVWVLDLAPEDMETVNGDILAWLDKYASERPKQSDDLSLQTDHDMYKGPAFKNLGPLVYKAVDHISDDLQLLDRTLQITGAWANISAPGVRHHIHAHPNNYLSAVYYVQTPTGGDTIRFYDPRPQAHVIQPQQKEWQLATASTVTVRAKPGRLVVFFSWLQHAVDPNSGDGERISIAINLMFRRFGEKMAQPMWRPKIETNPAKAKK